MSLPLVVIRITSLSLPFKGRLGGDGFSGIPFVLFPSLAKEGLGVV